MEHAQACTREHPGARHARGGVIQVPRGTAQGKDECIGLIGLDGFGLDGVGLHGAVPPSRRSTGGSTETCAGAAEPKAACAALSPRHDEATDAHETTEYRER